MSITGTSPLKIAPHSLRSDWLITLALTGVIGFAYLATPGQDSWKVGGDGFYYMLVARSLTRDLDLDLANDFREVGDPYSFGITPNGRARAMISVGAGLMFTPAMMAGRWVLGRPEAKVPDLHGPLGTFVCFTTVILGALLCFISVRAARRFVSGSLAWIGTIAVYGGTPAFFYTIFHPSYTHLPSAVACALAILLTLRWREALDRANNTDNTPHGNTSLAAALVGLGIGLAGLCRVQDLSIALFFVVAASGRLLAVHDRRVRFWIVRDIAIAGLVSIGLFGIQLALWVPAFGWTLASPAGEYHMRLSDPAWMLTLFSSRNGLFPWAPALPFAVVGMLWFARRDRSLFLALVVAAFVQWWINASVWDWWAGWSFGSRRFISVTTLFAIGAVGFLAAVHSAKERLGKFVRRGTIAAYAFSTVLGVGLAFNEGLTSGPKWLNRDMLDLYLHSIVAMGGAGAGPSGASRRTPIVRAIRTVLAPVYNALGNPFSWPMTWWVRVRYNLPIQQFDADYGKILLMRDYRSPYPYTEEYDLKDAAVWPLDLADLDPKSSGGPKLNGPTGNFLLPVFIAEELELALLVRTSTATPDQKLRVSWNHTTLGEASIAIAGDQWVRFDTKQAHVSRGFNKLQLDIAGKAAPSVAIPRISITATGPLRRP